MRRAVVAAKVLARSDVYRSDALRITAVEALAVGTFYLVTDSDTMYDEDFTALRHLDVLLGAPWRSRALKSTTSAHPHPNFPLSTKFAVHVVHPDYQTEGEFYEVGSARDPLCEPGRAVREMPEAV
ncbi:hypothetical protein [Streptomyces sp. NPDC005955]|uniref:hypothetical protein n=1 Tax=Streptomyces sp. NPDC005955 TaxID=3364738 RepID=UPI0036CFDC3D